jgi:hypothetical protein
LEDKASIHATLVALKKARRNARFANPGNSTTIIVVMIAAVDVVIGVGNSTSRHGSFLRECGHK